MSIGTDERAENGLERPFSPLAQEKPLRDRITDAIIDAILDARILPGTKIPEQELADQLGVSRVPVREAIRILEQQGMVTSRPKAGTYVTKLTPKEIDDGFRLRAALEEFALQEVLTRQSPQQWEALCERLSAIMDQMREAGEHQQWTRFTRLDLEWHAQHIDASGNSALSQAWRMLGLPLRFMAANRGVRRRDPKERAQTVGHHEELLASLMTRDPARVSAAIRQHCLRAVAPSVVPSQEVHPDGQGEANGDTASGSVSI
jgi:DNA-binding GntR family transcriptional regulator